MSAVLRVPSLLGVGLVWLYRLTFGALFPTTCKYHPSCSEYAVQSLRRHGLVKGSALAGWRLLRCNPWSHGGFDPVVEQRVFPLRRHLGAHRTTKHAGS